MNAKRVRVGLIGAGFVARVHAESYAQVADPGAEVVAVAAAHLPRAEALATEFGIPAAYDDYRRLLERADVDVVDLCVPNHLHEAIAVAAAEAGKHIICEKPLTGYFGGPEAAEPVGATSRRAMYEGTLASADRMLAAAQRHGVKLMYAENWLYMPAVQKARRLIAASGGTVLEIRGQECHSGSHAAYAKAWRSSGGGALLRLGAHPIGAAMFLKWEEGLRRRGEPIRVRAVTAEVADLTRIPSFQEEPQKWLGTGWEDVENWGALLMAFDDGSRATIFAADTVLGGIDNTLDVFLSNARVKCDMTHSTLLQAYAPSAEVFAGEYIAEKLETKAGWSFPSIDEQWLLGFPHELQDFVGAVAYGREPLSSAEFGREVVKVIYAAYVSAEEGRRVAL